MSKVSIGQKLWLFKGDERHPTQSRLLISSHANYTDIKGPNGPDTLVVPRGLTLHFYVKHDEAIKINSINSILMGDVVAVDTVVGDGQKTLTNYKLRKFQGRHGGGHDEDYAKIESLVQENVSFRKTDRKLKEESSKNQAAAFWDEQDVDHAEISFASNKYDFDVLTVRNRYFYSPPSLKEAIDLLQAAGYQYAHIHCCFCRAKKGDTSEPVSPKKYSPYDQG